MQGILETLPEFGFPLFLKGISILIRKDNDDS